MAVIAQIAVNQANFHFDKLYSYAVPEHLAQLVHIGSMVLVPFGYNSMKGRMGVVLRIDDTPNCTQKLKEIYDVAPEKARLSSELLSIVHYLKEHTFCTYYEAVKAIIPYGAQYQAVQEGGVPRLQKQLQPRIERYYSRAQSLEKMTAKQKFAWDYLVAPQSQADLQAQGVTKNVLDRLCEKGVLTYEWREKAFSPPPIEQTPAEVILSATQQKAFDTLCALLESNTPQAALLYGVTSSGKTLVFVKLIAQAIAMGRKALVLVPEISLTPQMIVRLKAHFGNRVAVQHSALNHTERLQQWQQIQAGEADIVVGTRSAIFAPLDQIGLIIIDEEQEHTYHSESAPRYRAHEVAKRRAVEHDALLVFASATPSIETYYAAQTGRYHLATLPERYNKNPLPSVQMVDMRTELASGRTGALSDALAQEIQANLQAGQQTILLLNRRGYKTVGICTECSQVHECDACSVPMVYHKAQEKLMCHYCGKTIEPVPEQCPKCGGKMRYTGFGTQRVEEELAEKFPQARVLRVDADSTGRKNAHETMLRKFAQGEYDIMIGTQMVAKGLDFEKVTLVGVLGVDQLLFAQGYKAFEHVFSLITQVIGRSGRATQSGRAIIQTVDPSHPVLQLAAQQDYDAFYEQEIGFRKLNLYPPFCAICRVCFTGKKEQEVVLAARAFATMVQTVSKTTNKVPLRVLGPAPMNILMVNNTYRYKLTLKCRNDNAFRALMQQAMAQYTKQKLADKATITLDFNADTEM